MLLNLFFISSIQADIVRRAAVDVGSGETKLTIADVDTETNRIVKVHYQDCKVVALRKDLATSLEGTLSKELEIKLLTTLKDFQTSTAKFSPDDWFGIGTSVFRSAKNGQQILEQIKTETGITIYLADQFEEGEIGFKSAVAASGLDANEIIAWDSGSSSFQITAIVDDQLEMYGAEFALVQAWEVLINTIRGGTLDTGYIMNPISLDETNLLSSIINNEKLPVIPNWLALTNKKIVCFGGYTSIFSVGQIATGKEVYTKNELLDAIGKFSGKKDDELSNFPDPRVAVLGLTLLYSVMDHCGINEIFYQKTNGGCEGLLIIPKYWE